MSDIKKKTSVTDMTEGKPFGLILRFSLHMMLGSIFQQLYVVIDTAIVGQTLGLEALGAVGTCDWFIWLVTGIVTGLTQGFAVMISQEYGSGNREGLRRATGQSVTLTAICGLIITAAAVALVPKFMVWVNVPLETQPLSMAYTRAIFWGIPVTAAYNIAAGILRALGDGKTPLVAMIIAAILNVVLDLFCILVLQMGVAGAAVATVAAQFFAFAFCLAVLLKRKTIGVAKEDFRLEITRTKNLFVLGVPVAFQNFIIAAGGMVLQSIVNAFGIVFMAGYTATNKVCGVLEMAAVSYGSAMTTFAGQNLGAGKIQRIKKGVKVAVLTAVCTALVIGGLMMLAGKPVLGIFIDSSQASADEAMQFALRYLYIMCIFLVTLYMLHVYRATLIGLGKSVLGLLSGLAECAVRLFAAFTLTKIFGSDGIFFGEVLAWVGGMLLLVVVYYPYIHKLSKKMQQEA